MDLTSRDFWAAVVDRAVRTFAQGMLGALGTAVVGFTDIDWLGAASVGLASAAMSVLTSVAVGIPEADSSGRHMA